MRRAEMFMAVGGIRVDAEAALTLYRRVLDGQTITPALIEHALESIVDQSQAILDEIAATPRTPHRTDV